MQNGSDHLMGTVCVCVQPGEEKNEGDFHEVYR